jgi:hypothetical protein
MVHDGAVHPTADFDHELYCQPDPAWEPMLDWERSRATTELLGDRARTWVTRGAWLLRTELRGELPNRDTSLSETKLRARNVIGPSFRCFSGRARSRVRLTGQRPDQRSPTLVVGSGRAVDAC